MLVLDYCHQITTGLLATTITWKKLSSVMPGKVFLNENDYIVTLDASCTWLYVI